MELIQRHVHRLCVYRVQLLVGQGVGKRDLSVIVYLVRHPVDRPRQRRPRREAPAVTQPVAGPHVRLQTRGVVAQRYRDPDVAVHDLVERNAGLHQAVAQIHRVADVRGQLRRLGRRRDHVRTLKLRKLGVERYAGKRQQRGDDRNGFFHDVCFGVNVYNTTELSLTRYELF